MKESQDQVTTVSQASKPAIHQPAQFAHIGGCSISQVLLNVPMAILLGVNFGRIRRQPLDFDFPVIGQVLTDHAGPMRRGPVPDQKEQAPDASAQMFQHRDDVRPGDRFVEMTLIDPTAHRQSHRGRQDPARLGRTTQNRRSSPRRPGAPQRRQEREAHFIEENDFGVEPPRFFLFGANPSAATLGRVPPRARPHAPPAVADSSPIGAAGG